MTFCNFIGCVRKYVMEELKPYYPAFFINYVEWENIIDVVWEMIYDPAFRDKEHIHFYILVVQNQTHMSWQTRKKSYIALW